MKRYKCILLPLCCLVCLLSAACGNKNGLIGTWKYSITAEITNSDNVEPEKVTASCYYVFNKDNTGIRIVEIPGFTDENKEAVTDDFLYEIKGSRITIMFDSGRKDYYEVEVNAESLALINKKYGSLYMELV